MDSPVFKLEQVVHNREGMEDFEGPLDLILFLLSKNKIDMIKKGSCMFATAFFCPRRSF